MRPMRGALWMTFLVTVGCGTWIGNPNGDDDEGTTTQAMAIPKVSFLLPTPAGASLRADDDQVLTSWVGRINDHVKSLNDDVDRMNKEYTFAGAGTLSGKGSLGDESGTYSELKDGTYDYQVIVCRAGKVSTLTKWSADGKRIASERDLNQKPDAPEDVRVKTVYDEADGKHLVLQFHGTPRGVPSGADGKYAATWDEARQVADGSFTVRGVQDYFTPSAGTTFTGDAYLTGKLSAAGEGEYVGYTKWSSPECDGVTFSEADPTQTWCASRKVGAAALYTIAEAATAWTERLKPIGVGEQKNLATLVIGTACP